MNRNGFTLIELMAVISIIMFVFTVTLGVLLNTFRGTNRIETSGLVEQQGTWVVAQIRRLLLEADPNTLVCAGSSILFNSIVDGGQTTITCDSVDASISSASATLTGNTVFPMSTADLSVGGCATFVSCTTPVGGSPVINFAFTMTRGSSAGFSDTYNSRQFSGQVTVRN